jgi:CDGSH-type Zn-finger protein
MDPLIDDVAEVAGVRITPYPDGPLIVRGEFVISEVSGDEIASGHSVALCRCGRSALKPFCDGSHKIRARAEVTTRDDD